jgi:putative aminopeptidase FrvX
VRIRNSEGKYITGIISSKPPHFMTEAERKKIIEISDMTIDIGAASGEEVIEKYGIAHGAPIVPDVAFEYQKDNGIMIGKAFDNRIGCALVLDVLQRLQGKKLPVNIVGGIAAQEEVGSRGAEITGRAVKPDVAIVFEGTPADDTHKQLADIQGGIRKGVQIRHRDRSYVSNPRFVKMARDIAKEKEIKFQDAVRESGGTDAGKIALSHTAVPVLVLGVPVRYIHTHYGISAYEDYENTLSLALKVIHNLSKNKIEQL